MSLEAELPGKRVIPEQFQMIYTRYSSTTDFIKNKEVLEVGCGPGLGLGYLNNYAKRVIGGDYSLSNVEIARNHYKSRVEVLVFNAHNLPFKSGSFDGVIAMEVLLYLDVPKFLSECYKILRKNGIIIICIPNKDRLGFYPSKLSKNYFSVSELIDHFQAHNFIPKIYGAFKIKEGSTIEEPWDKSKKNQIIDSIGRILRRIPGGTYIKNYIGKLIFRKAPLPNELTPGMIEERELIELSPVEANDSFKILYAFAVKDT